jgi:hypothetical protein
MLEAGVDALTVSALLGHADGAMLAKVYSHLAKNSSFLRASLNAGCRGVGGSPSSVGPAGVVVGNPLRADEGDAG